MTTAPGWETVGLSGRLRIEASAGTGKTWTIAALYLRLLLDDGEERGPLQPEQIVVATFTEAAAAELGARLRARLQQALGWATAGGDSTPAGADADADADAGAADDPVRNWLARRWQAGPAQGGREHPRERDRQRLLAALAATDRAPVGTLHALCLRILREYPLDGRLGFAPQQPSAGRTLRDGLARDLLRRIAAGEPPPHACRLPADCGDIDALAQRIGVLLQPGARVSPPPDLDTLRTRLDAEARAALTELMRKDGHYSHIGNAIFNAVKAALAFIDGGALPRSLGALLDPAEINKDRVLPGARAKVLDPALQSAIGRFESERERLGDGVRAFWSWWLPELQRAQARLSVETGVLAFDQLVERVHAAVQRDDSPLPAALAARWPVVLVDEFQDTDAAQYALLDAWQRAGNGRGLLAIVGDPKQAIYRFRGGDIGVYLRAAGAARARLELSVNQRSHSRYVDALNHVFRDARGWLSSAATPIRVEPVSAARRADAEALHLDAMPVLRPLVFHEWPAGGDAPSNAQARPLALGACADLVVELLAPGRARLGQQALAPGDLAVLLVSNAEIDALRRQLQHRGVPVAGQARRSVFAGEAARELRLALLAVLHPGNAGALRAALLTPLFGLDAKQLAAFESAGGLEEFRQRCATWRLLWLHCGVLAVVHALLRETWPQLGRRADGERRLTDLRHLGELLQAEAAGRHRPQGLLDWLAEQCRSEDEIHGGERLLRLESDARRVRLMTLHASKGLQFPVVLLPTLWAHEHSSRQSGVLLDSACAEGQREVLFESGALKARRGELQDERFRLLYVALTRAQQACHVFTLPQGRPEKAGGTSTRTDPERSALDALLARWPDAERGAAHPCVEWRRGWPEPGVATAARFDIEPSAALVEAPLPGPFVLPGRYSFSWLTDGEPDAALEARAADDEPGAAPTAAAGSSDDPLLASLSGTEQVALEAELAALAMVRGKDFGNALHELLEQPPPGRRYADDPAGVFEVLRAHAVRRRDGADLGALVPRIAALLDRAWSTSLPLPGAPALGGLPMAARRAELGFHFRLDSVDWLPLRALAASHGEPTLIPTGRETRLVGSMEGFIDLVFEHQGRAHVLDWKGNALPGLAAATPQGLRAVMDASHYRFQAFLYTVALHRLLRQRHGARYAIERHLGAPVYVFLRAFGLAPQLAPGLGVWTQAFPSALVEAVDRHLGGGRA